MDTNLIFYCAIAVGVVALVFAYIKYLSITKIEPGNERMKEISGYIEEGAMAFLVREYKYLVIFVVVVAIILGAAIDLLTAVCFLAGSICSILAGFFGMKAATKANVRTANAAKEFGMGKALQTAFSGGAVMGLSVVGLGILGMTVCYFLVEDVNIVTGFSFGASSIALFGRVGGGIYTKAADVGADLVGKVEAGIPEDDPRNPAVIADNVGDNVGDVAGMGADLFESYVGSIISAITIGIPSFFLTFESNKEKVSTHFMRDILTNATIGGGVLVASVLLTNFFITVPGQVKFICFLLALINGLCLVAKVSLPFNRYKLLLLTFLSLAALVGVLANTFILQGAFVPLEAKEMLYVAILAVVIGGLHYLTRRKS